MKILALGAAIAALISVGIIHSVAAQTVHPRSLNAATFRVSAVHTLGLRLHARVMDSASDTPTTTPGPTSTPAPTPTPTVNPFPDPVTVLTNGLNAMDQVQNIAFTDHAVQVDGNDKLTIDATAKANCAGPAVQGHVKGTNTLEGTAQNSTTEFDVIQIKSNYWIRSKKATKNKWTKTTAKKAQAFGFSVDNPLNCPGASTSSGSGTQAASGPVIKNLVNSGPDTFQGVKVWHIHATGIYNDAQTGQALPLVYDWLVSQDHNILYSRTVIIDDSAHGFTLNFTENYSDIGKKVTIKAPKTG